jgi:acyl-CoA dehydrogenase
MNFEPSERSRELAARIEKFLEERIVPGEVAIAEEIAAAGNPHHYPSVLDELKAEAREQGLWNLFLTNNELGPGLTNVEYAPLAELMGRTPNAAEVFNCSAPDTGNMEILALFGTPEQKERWLAPLMDGTIRSTFSMTEPAVASSDATNLETRIERDGDHYVLTGRKWFASGLLNPRCRLIVVMGKTDPTAPIHRQHSMLLVERDHPGVKVLRSTPVYGYEHRGGHCEVVYDQVRVPATNLVAGEGDGFMIAQARLGPGRIHHAMRMIGMAEVALEHLVARAEVRRTFGTPVIDQGVIQEAIALSRIEIDQCRLAVLHTAWMIDVVGAKEARGEIAAIKVAVPRMAARVLDRAIQVHGAAGFTPDFPLAEMWVHARTVQMGDGPDEVHLRTLGRLETQRQRERRARKAS